MTVAVAPLAETTLRERKKAQTRGAIHEAALRLVDAHGLDGVTIEQICAEADVSPRTFFNYFPSKPAAALGLPSQVVPDQAIERFQTSEEGLVGALCGLIAETFSQGRAERKRIKELVAHRPELQPAFGQWVGALRTRVLEIAETRAERTEDAELAVTLVLAALSMAAHGEGASRGSVGDRLRQIIARLGAIARE